MGSLFVCNLLGEEHHPTAHNWFGVVVVRMYRQLWSTLLSRMSERKVEKTVCFAEDSLIPSGTLGSWVASWDLLDRGLLDATLLIGTRVGVTWPIYFLS